MDRLGDVSGVDLVVVRVLVLPIPRLQSIQESHQKHSGKLQSEGGNGDTRKICGNGRRPRAEISNAIAPSEAARHRERLGSAVGHTGLASWLYHLLPVRPWAGHVPFPVPQILHCRVKTPPPTLNLMR